MVKKPIFRSNPEHKIESNLRRFLEIRGWLVEKTHSTAYSSGWPDLMCWHLDYGLRWVDVKVPGQHRYTKAQCQKWPAWEKGGLGVWVLMGATDEWYSKLFKPPNFREYWKPHYDKYLIPVGDILDELA